VEFTTIENLCIKISSGATPNTGRSEFYNGDIPWLRTQEVDWTDIVDTGVKITTTGLENSSANWIPKNCVIVAMYGATAAKVAINKIPLTTNQACCNLQVDEKKALFKYVYFWMCNKYEELKALGQGSQSNINAGIVRKFPIAMPPLEIQRETVRILDKFTGLTAELVTEITAELVARKKQYYFYRDKLLTAGENIPIVQLGDIADFKYGYTDKAKDSGTTRFVRITDIGDNGKLLYTNSKYIDLTSESEGYLLSKGDLLMARTGATYGKTMLFDGGISAVYASFLIRIRFPKREVLPTYYWHFAQSNAYWGQANRLVSKAGQPQFNANVLKSVLMPVPPINEQQKVVDLLDRFDALINGISKDLPAEIEARHKQYEYYRDNLLTFQQNDTKRRTK